MLQQASPKGCSHLVACSALVSRPCALHRVISRWAERAVLPVIELGLQCLEVAVQRQLGCAVHCLPCSRVETKIDGYPAIYAKLCTLLLNPEKAATQPSCHAKQVGLSPSKAIQLHLAGSPGMQLVFKPRPNNGLEIQNLQALEHTPLPYHGARMPKLIVPSLTRRRHDHGQTRHYK